MVFGLFSRTPKSEPKHDPAPAAVPIQLRTPSPSVVGSSSSPGHLDVPQPPPITPSPPPELVTDPTALRQLIQSVPAKSFHAYTLAHLSTATAPPPVLAALTQFFSALAPPPVLHCVRCHKGFFDVENTDRSCLVGHDDESAEVERVGSGYETLWGCCGKTVEGDGDMGPPDGWCYEGLHTTDLKRARFRADSTIHDDKLTTCTRLRCHEPPSSRKRSRRHTNNFDSEDSDSDDDGASHSSVRTRSHTSRAKRVRLSEPSRVEDGDEDVEMSPAAASVPTSPTRKPQKPRARARATSVSSTASAPKGRKGKTKASAGTETAPASPGKKPSSTRFVAPDASFTSERTEMPSSQPSMMNEKEKGKEKDKETQAPPKSKRAAMKPKSTAAVSNSNTPKSNSAPTTLKRAKTKKLNEVVESSIVGETA